MAQAFNNHVTVPLGTTEESKGVDALNPCYSECSPWIGPSSISWELVGKVWPQVSP